MSERPTRVPSSQNGGDWVVYAVELEAQVEQAQKRERELLALATEVADAQWTRLDTYNETEDDPGPMARLREYLAALSHLQEKGTDG